MMEHAWKAAARHWWERMRQAERERDELRSRLVDISEDFSSLEYDAARVVSALNGDPDRLRDAIEIMRDSGRSGWWHAKPSGIPGEFAELAARIAKADAKHPRDLPDTSHEINAERAVSRLRLARARVELEAFHAWDNAFECEVAEAFVEIALGNPERLADELLDVATVTMRWRRAVLERGKR